MFEILENVISNWFPEMSNVFQSISRTRLSNKTLYKPFEIRNWCQPKLCLTQNTRAEVDTLSPPQKEREFIVFGTDPVGIGVGVTHSYFQDTCIE